MQSHSITTYSPSDYVIALPDNSYHSNIIHDVHVKVCRTDFSTPGFCLIDLGPKSNSIEMRKAMVAIKRALQEIIRARSKRELLYLSAERFDQQQTTKFHLDGAPKESILMLGYEPTEIESEVALADYSQCARDLNLTPDEFLSRHNPMFAQGAKLLEDYVTKLTAFSNEHFQIILINNSLTPLNGPDAGWQGVLHTATILTPDQSKRRVINSTMLGVFPSGTSESISAADQDQFTTTTLIRRKGYDNPDLQDDI